MSQEDPTVSQVQEHLSRFPGLYVRDGDHIVEAPQADVDVAKSYATSENKGRLEAGRRITILCAKSVYRLGEPVRVIHVLEATEPGHEVLIMGPKAIRGEYVDGELQPAPPVNPLYDGAILGSPAVDHNYNISEYTFSTSGKHTIVWRTDGLESNELVVTVVE